MNSSYISQWLRRMGRVCTTFRLVQALGVITLLLSSFWVVGPKPLFAQAGTECARPQNYPAAAIYRDLGNNTYTAPPLYRGQGGLAILNVPPLTPGYSERNFRYSVVAQTVTVGYIMPITALSADNVKFTFPANVPLGSYIFRVERVSDRFDPGSNYIGVRVVVFCSPITGVVEAPPPPGPLSNVSAASYTAPVAPDSIVAAFGQNLAVESKSAALPLPTALSGTTVKVTDSARVTRPASIFSVAPGQVNYLMPPETAAGQATVDITSGAGQRSVGTVQVAPVAPGLISQNSDGKGVAAANALRIKPDNSQVYEPVSRFDAATNRFVPLEIDLSSDQVYLILYGTGIRRASNVTLKIGGMEVAAQWFGPQPSNVGTDQINVLLPTTLIGRKVVDVQLIANNLPSNVVQISVK